MFFRGIISSEHKILKLNPLRFFNECNVLEKCVMCMNLPIIWKKKNSEEIDLLSIATDRDVYREQLRRIAIELSRKEIHILEAGISL